MPAPTNTLRQCALAILAAGMLLAGYASDGSPGAGEPGANSTGGCPAASAPAPVFQGLTFPKQMQGNDSVRPEFHFRDSSGAVRYIHRELVRTDNPAVRINSGSILLIPASEQRSGAVFVGGWRCGVGKYYVTIRGFFINLEGRKSNARQWTIHCNGG